MLLSDVQYLVKREFGDEAGTQIDDTDIAKWASDAQVDIARQTKCNITVSSTLSVFEEESYSILRSLSIYSVTYDGIGLTAITLQDATQRWPYRSTSPVGTPRYFWVTDGVQGATLYLYPTPDASDRTIEVQHNTRPSPVSAPSDTLEIPEQYRRLVVDICLKRAYGLDGQLNAVDRLNVSLKSDMVDAAGESGDKKENSFPAIRCLPGDEGYG